MEANRLLWDDGRALLRQPAAGKTQRDHRLEGWAAAGLASASHMRQEDHLGGRKQLSGKRVQQGRYRRERPLYSCI